MSNQTGNQAITRTLQPWCASVSPCLHYLLGQLKIHTCEMPLILSDLISTILYLMTCISVRHVYTVFYASLKLCVQPATHLQNAIDNFSDLISEWLISTVLNFMTSADRDIRSCTHPCLNFLPNRQTFYN